MDIPEYTDEEYWNNVIRQYIAGDPEFTCRFDIELHMWRYFKFCLKKQNPFFFHHALIPLLEAIFSEHTCVLKSGTEIYRARNDKDRCLWTEWRDYCDIEYIQECLKDLEERNGDRKVIQEKQKTYDAFLNEPRAKKIKERIESGFQGFDAKGSSAPPWEKAVAGRCNPKGVSYLYTALESQTAVAEIRPHIKDTISIALLKPIRDLKLVDFDYDLDTDVDGKDFLFNVIRKDFSVRDIDRDDDYLVTQYITALIENLGCDGICFRSSLVKDGTNYVVFDPDTCQVVSSELCFLSEVKYVFGKCK